MLKTALWICLMALTLLVGLENFYLTGTLIIIEAMIPFFARFESRRPQAGKLVLIAIMSALAAVSRTAFAFLPHFKPVTAIVMIGGMALGPQAGFLTGALTAFASNFVFGQGMWTPWQMFAFGMGGCLAGIAFRKQKKYAPWAYAVFGFCAIMLLVGPLLDCSSLFFFGGNLTMEHVITIFAVGLVPNVLHGISCAATLLLIGTPLRNKLQRLQTKYDI